MKIALVSPSLGLCSQTFIQSHIDLLPAEISLFHGGESRPLYYDEHVPISSLLLQQFPVPYEKHPLLSRIKDEKRHRDIARILKRKKIQVILAEFGPNGVGMMRACKLVNIPLIVYFRGYDVYKTEILNKYKAQYSSLFTQASALIAVSLKIKQKLTELGADPHKVHHIPSGVDTQKFFPGDPRKSPPVFLAVGRFVAKKGPDLTVLAFKKVVEQMPEAKLIMIGDGPLLEVCQRMARALGINEQIDWVGACPHEIVVEKMQQARAFVQHSITVTSGDAEGTPNTIKEAHASGLPVVSTSNGGIPEIVVDQVTGFLVEEGDVDGMANAMITLAKDPELARKMGLAGRSWVEEHFSMEKSINDLWTVIQSVA